MDVAEYFTAKEAARFSDLTPHMINYLCRAGVLEPSARAIRGRGRHRTYTFGDIVVLRTLKRLLDSGVSVARLKKGLEDLRRYHPEITRSSLPSQYLVTDGQRIYFRKNKKVVLESLDGTGQFAFAFVVELQQIRNEVVEAIEAGGMRS